MMKVTKFYILAVLLIIIASSVAFGRPFTTEGQLSGTGDEQYFEVYAGNDTYIEVEFEVPPGVNFWIDVYGQFGNLLGSYNPSEGRVIQLTGGGKFTIYVVSEGGSGSWSAHWETE